jgi:hypothetical protein
MGISNATYQAATDFPVAVLQAFEKRLHYWGLKR